MRLIYKRVPKDLNNELSLCIKIIFIQILLIFIILLLQNIKIYLIKNKYLILNSSNNNIKKIFLYYLQLGSQFLSKSLSLVHERLIETKFSPYIEKLGSYLTTNCKFYSTCYLTIIFNFIPKIIVLLVFLIDVFIFNQLKYFYVFGSLLLIPLIYQYVNYAIYQDALKGIIDSNNYLVIMDKHTGEVITALNYFKICSRSKLEYTNELDISKFKYTFNDSFLEQNKENPKINYVATLSQFMVEINALVEIASYTQFITIWYEINVPLFNIFIYFSYVMGWGYILYLIY